jgi:Flp pilus assembly pilin Flp
LRAPATRGGDGAAGQGLIEYGLILAIMAVVCVVSLLFFSDQLSSLLSLIASAV